MLSNNEVKETFIAYAKAQSSLTDEVGDEIRELSWMGTDFTYPNIRFRVIDNAAIQDCDISSILASFVVYSENLSSLEADRIAGIIKDILHKRSFSSNGYAISQSYVTSLVPAIAQTEKTWRSEVIFRAKMSNPS